MALTFTEAVRTVHGNQRVWQGKVTLDSSYPTGGEAVDPALLGMSTIEMAVASQDGAGSRIIQWDQTNKKIVVFTAVGTEAAGSSNQSAISLNFTAWGR